MGKGTPGAAGGPFKPLRVLYVEANEDGTVGGSHQLLYDLVRGLPRDRIEPVVLFYQDNAFVERLQSLGVTVIACDEMRAHEREANVTRGVLGRRAAQLAAVGRRFRFLRREHIGLVHLNNSPTVGYDDWLPAAMCAGVPCIANAAGLLVDRRRLIQGVLSRGFARVIGISDFMASLLRAQGYQERQIECVNLAVDDDRLRSRVSASRADVRAKLHIPQDRVVITMVGNVRRWKGQHILLAAVEQLPSAVRSHIHVLCVGAVSEADAGYFAELQDMVRRAQLADTVQFLGARSDVPNLLVASDIAVHASILPEPFGLVIVEAMAFGLPVVASGLGAPSQIVTSSAGLLYDPESPRDLADQISRLVMDERLRKRLGEGGRKRSEDFRPRRYVSEIVAIYEKVAPLLREPGPHATRA